jgi:hypothetical protein
LVGAPPFFAILRYSSIFNGCERAVLQSRQ